MGRHSYKPPKYHFQRAWRMKREGYNDASVADALGICHATYNKYKSDFLRFFARKRKEERDASVREPGRPPGIGLTPKMAEQAIHLALCEFSGVKIAEFLGVAESTLRSWRKADADFDTRYRQAKENADAAIIGALRHRALGFDAVNTTEVSTTDRQGNVVQRNITTMRKHIAPSVAAIKLWLINRQGWVGEAQSDAGAGNADELRVEYDVREKLYAENGNGNGNGHTDKGENSDQETRAGKEATAA